MTETPLPWRAALAAAAKMQPMARGTEPRNLLAARGPFRLYRYRSPALRTQPPILLVYSLVNRPDLLDLAPGTSLIGDLRTAGFPVYLVDWGYPQLADGLLDLEDYVTGFLSEAVHRTVADARRAPMVAGVCQGGTLALMLAAHTPPLIKSLATIATPVDFHAGDAQLTRLAHCWPMPTDQARPGLIRGDRLSAGFTALRPADLLLRRYMRLADLGGDTAALEAFLRTEAWMYDCPDQPAPVFHRFLQEMYLDNALTRGQLRLDGQRIHLHAVRSDILNVHAADDHLVPSESSRALGKHAAGAASYAELPMPGGHLGLFLSRRNRGRLVDALLAHAANDL